MGVPTSVNTDHLNHCYIIMFPFLQNKVLQKRKKCEKTPNMTDMNVAANSQLM